MFFGTSLSAYSKIGFGTAMGFGDILDGM